SVVHCPPPAFSSRCTPAATPPIYTLPYTTLFRSARPAALPTDPGLRGHGSGSARRRRGEPRRAPRRRGRQQSASRLPLRDAGGRSEEHTSELQSRENLVCRLLLEKKKQHASTQAQ